MSVDIIEQLIKAREKRGWSRYRLSKESHVTQAVLSRIEHKTNSPTIDTLQPIIQALGMELTLRDKCPDMQGSSIHPHPSCSPSGMLRVPAGFTYDG